MLEGQKKMSTWFYALLSLPATAMGFGLSVQISALSWILSTKYGLSIGDIGIVWAAGPIAGIIAQPIVGLVSDKLWFMGGRRRPWIVLGGVLTGLMLLALPNLEIVQKILGMEGPAGLLPIAVCVALTLDLSINVSFNPTRSLVADCTTQEQRSKGYTWMQTVSGTFGVLAYLVAVIWGNEALIYVGMVIAVLFTVFPIFFIEEPRELKSEDKTFRFNVAGFSEDPIFCSTMNISTHSMYISDTKMKELDGADIGFEMGFVYKGITDREVLKQENLDLEDIDVVRNELKFGILY